MAPTQDIEVEGVTAFARPPTTSYRYVLQLENDKLSIWMEDRTSKKQCMAKADYVTSVNAVTDASAVDYLKCFQDALDGELGEAGDVQCTLELLNGGALRLSFAVKIRVIRSVRVAKYTFDLDPVSVERIDVLESKVRDLRDELERIENKFKTLLAGEVPMFIQLKARRMVKIGGTSKISWEKIESDVFIITEANGEIKVTRAGVYSISAVVSCKSNDEDDQVYLMKNKECIQANYCGYMKYCFESFPLNHIARLEKDDELAVASICYDCGTSYLSIVRLGN